ncbi:MAG: hypothetical protein DMF89_26960 [Acidobacteria bacterium]|nr:MAG: hypothetical protein DMF89_26960 [Acidobacteriota bacterium]
MKGRRARSSRPKSTRADLAPRVDVREHSSERENARRKRLEKALNSSLEQQSATAEILRVISSSPTDAQPVFATILARATRLCEASFGALFRVEGDSLLVAAHHKLSSQEIAALEQVYPQPLDGGAIPARAVLERSVIHVHDVASYPTNPLRDLQRQVGFRTTLQVPMLKDGEVIGVLSLWRRTVSPFSAQHVELLKTFADQAVIAIENVRLFNELQDRNRSLTEAHAQVTEALEQQTATAEILGVISSSPTDPRPVFDAIADSAVRLTGAHFGAVMLFDGQTVDLATLRPPGLPLEREFRSTFPLRGEDLRPLEPVVIGGAIRHVADMQDPSVPELSRLRAQLAGYRGLLQIPMITGDRVLGVLGVARREPGRFTDSQIALLQTFADQAVIAIENVRLFTELQQKNEALTQAHAQVSESLKQQTATGEILKVISGSPTDVQPVFNTIVRSAVRLCNGFFGNVLRYDGHVVSMAADHHFRGAGLEVLRRLYPGPLVPDSLSGRALLSRAVVHVHDVANDPQLPAGAALARAAGFRTAISVPMLREGEPIGTINVARAEVQPFSQTEIDLLKTFADQAVIAIENVRLFKELEGRNRDLTVALDQQTATSEILRIIASSPTDLQPVLDAMAESAARLCSSHDANIFRLDGDVLRLVAHHGPLTLPSGFVVSATRGTISGRAVLDRQTVQVADLQAEAEEFPEMSSIAQQFGYRTILSVPLLREGAAIGAIALRRTEVQPFTDRQSALLQTFADQAVIAIENVRLFTELETRNNELRVALEQQTATSELLKVIGRSTFDLQPVFETLAENAVRLCEADHANIWRFDGELLRVAASHNASPELRAFMQRPAALTRGSIAGRAALERRTVQVLDILADSEYTYGRLQVDPVRTVLAIPMLRTGELLGVIAIFRHEVLAFTDSQIALMETFADQAAIAIENARLLTELQARTAELTRSVNELQALGEVGQALSSTLNLEVVLNTIVARANELTGTAGCTIWEYDAVREEFRLRVSHYADEADAVLLEALGRVTTIRKGQGVTTQGAYESPIRGPLIEAGHRALLGVPLLREDEVIGVLAVTRKKPGEFEPEVVRLLSTLATQSALAIQNARLFLEIEDKSRQLEIASQHKSDFLANMSHELRTPLNAIIGFSEVLLERMFGEINDKQTEYLQDILESGRHLLSLINDILDLSKIEAGRMELEVTDFDLPTAVENALILVRERAMRRGIALHHAVDARLGEITGDERKLKQVLLNLLSNALKFTVAGGRIDVRAGLVDGMAEISVTDTGVGIAPADLEAVFEEFRQVGGSEKKAEGTGLGLTLCRKFVELHGGRIWVKSQVGAGSTFTFTLPVRRGE